MTDHDRPGPCTILRPSILFQKIYLLLAEFRKCLTNCLKNKKKKEAVLSGTDKPAVRETPGNTVVQFSSHQSRAGRQTPVLYVAMWGPRPICLIPVPFPRVLPSLAGLPSCLCSAQRKEAVWRHFCSVIGSGLRNSPHYFCSCSSGEYCYVARPNCKEGWEMQSRRAALYPEQGREWVLVDNLLLLQ